MPRLSTAFDSVTLYGEDPATRPDIYGKVGISGEKLVSAETYQRMMGDIQQYFVDHQVRNFYSVSISGYHIAEAGANPISQLAFTLSNGFTIVEYYLARGMSIDDFAPNLSFFFSNGMDPEYTVIGRVARRIWARAMRERYGANQRSKIQEESMYYEHKKHDGSLPLIGVNTLLGGKESHVEGGEVELMRSTEKEKVQQVENVAVYRSAHGDEAGPLLAQLQETARRRENTFEALMEAGKVCSLGSMSHALYEVGGEYRRNARLQPPSARADSSACRHYRALPALSANDPSIRRSSADLRAKGV